ncbi:hypothetical protein FHG87_010085 [Trinorchestia longiramus]|nr:hypothetical protein FHG87_010085 [Trinorchestia longiramus]
MSSHEGGQGRGGAGHTARSLLPTPVISRPPRLHIAEPLPRRINTTHQNTTLRSNNHSTNSLNTRPTYNHTKNTTFRIQLRKINPNITTDKQKIFETTFEDLDVPLTKLTENNSGYYALTDEAAAVDKLTSSKATELFKKINLRPIIPPDISSQIELEKYTYIQICFKCYKFEDHATYQCTSTTHSCSECASHQHTHQQCNSPTKKCLNCNQQHRTLAATCPYREQVIHQKN